MPQLRRPTLRMRLALLYGGLFLASGAALVAFTDALLLGEGSVRQTVPVGGVPAVGAGSAANAAHARGHHFTDLHQLVIFSVVVLALMVVAAGILGWLVAGRVLQPLHTIMATARDISASNLHERLDLDGPYDEFTQLGATLDDLFGRLEASFESQRHFVANASHELRTPLTAERTLLQVALADPDASAESLRSTCEELLTLSRQQERLIESLLTLASSEGGVDQRQRFDLADVAAHTVLVRQDDASRRGVGVEATLTPALVAGDRGLVESLVANLVDNALRHNVAGGAMAITTATTAGRATISVRNTGPVIPPADLDRLFQPFQRLGDERVRHHDGHGLGLTIVDAIARAHEADLTARPPAEGGLEVVVTFPAPAVIATPFR